jgi:hypothetical protein
MRYIVALVGVLLITYAITDSFAPNVRIVMQPTDSGEITALDKNLVSECLTEYPRPLIGTSKQWAQDLQGCFNGNPGTQEWKVYPS